MIVTFEPSASASMSERPVDREIRAREHRVGFPIRVGDFVNVDLVEHDLNAHATSALRIFNKNKFPSSALGDISK
jgi:hypothetical protein